MAEVTSSDTELRVVKQVEVARSRADAFRIFTEGFSEWWPLESHSIFGSEATAAIIEPRVGGRIFERTDDGREADWGAVVSWDPPHSLAVTWKPNLDDDAPWTSWSVTFSELGADRTRLTLTHSGWEAFGDRAHDAHSRYQVGWDPVLAEFVATTAR